MHRQIAASNLYEESSLRPADYDRLAGLLSQRLGIKLPSNKRSMLDVRLRGRIRELGFATHDAYCDHLFGDDGGLDAEMQHLVDAVTTNKTDFFREPDHFELMRNRLVAELLALRPRESNPRLKLWSAASSNGAEAYTAAMVLQAMADTYRFRFAILGTDVSMRVLAQARTAVYPADMVRPVPARLAERFVLHARDSRAGTVRIAPELRRLVRFSTLNLMDQSYDVDRDVDIVMLRNVLIYFEKADQEAVITRLLGHVRTGGFLFLGHSEAMIGSSMGLEQVAPAVFRKS